MAGILRLPTIGFAQNCSEYSNNYHGYECCDVTRGIDNLLLRYKHDREYIINLMLTNPNQLVDTIWKQDGPLAIDNQCRCQMGICDKRSPFACAQCKNLRRLIDFRFDTINKPFKIECGNYAGKSLIVSNTEISTPYIIWDNDSAQRARNYVNQYRDLKICGTPDVDDMKCITGDSFTIRTLLLWMINHHFEKKGLFHIPKLHTAFVCSGMGYSLYDFPTIGSISDLHKIDKYHTPCKSNALCKSLIPSITRSIILQLLVILSELSSVNFSHGSPSLNALIFTKDPVSYKYDDVHVEGQLTLQLGDFSNSSATFNSTHFFPKNVKSSMYIERNMFIPEIVTKTVSMAHCHDKSQSECSISNDICRERDVILYRLTNSTIEIYNALRHIGFPLYVGSFDFYCFMVSLMCDKSFYDSVINDDNLYRLWSMMWLADDLPIVDNAVKTIHDKIVNGNISSITSNISVDIIRGKWLRCDIVKYIWSLIKLGF